MSLKKKFLAVAAPAALLMLSACTTGMTARVSRFQAMPAPQGQSFVIQAEDRDKNRRPRIRPICRSRPPPFDCSGLYRGARGGRGELRRHARLRRRPGPRARHRHARSLRRSLGLSRLRLSRLRSRPFFSRFGYYRPPQSLLLGLARSVLGPATTCGATRSIRASSTWTSAAPATASRCSKATPRPAPRSDELPVLVPNLIEAMFTGFPGNSGETVRITVMPEREARR